jgi:hypothetical protein
MMVFPTEVKKHRPLGLGSHQGKFGMSAFDIGLQKCKKCWILEGKGIRDDFWLQLAEMVR